MLLFRSKSERLFSVTSLFYWIWRLDPLIRVLLALMDSLYKLEPCCLQELKAHWLMGKKEKNEGGCFVNEIGSKFFVVWVVDW